MPRHFSSWASPPQPPGEPSRDLAIDYLRKAGLAGNKEARYQLARLLIDQGGEEERKEAQSILEKLAKNDTGAASLLLGEGTLQGWFGDEADFEKNRFWWEQSAGKGDVTAILALARLLDGNFGFPEKRDPSAALNHFLRAAELDNPAAMVAVGSRLLNGEGLQIVEGYAHLVAAAEAGLADVQNKVGLFYLSGRLGIRDATGAAGWFSRSAAGGFPQGAHNLGTLYEQGVGLPRNPVQAGRLYNLAANAGHPQATTALGRLHAKGIGTKQDLPKAWALFSLAVERGDDEAKAPIGELTSQLAPW